MNGERSTSDWMLFGILTLLWAGAYALTRVAVDKGDPSLGMPVEYVLAGRLTIGGCMLTGFMLLQGNRWPAIHDLRAWAFIAMLGLVGATVPFYLITTAQETVDSSLAALYAAAAPCFVVAGAHFLFHDEPFTRRKGLGILAGFLGVAILFGPEAFANFGSASMHAQLMLIAATMCYGSTSLLIRLAPQMNPISLASAFVMASAIFSWPLVLSVDMSATSVLPKHIGAVIALGIFPTAIAQALYVIMINRAGATFMSLVGYSIPIASAILGWIFFREMQGWNAFLAFALILGGVWLAQRGGPSAPSVKDETSPQ